MRKRLVSWIAALLGVEVYIDGVRRGAISISVAQGDSS
jgi:hypothetical protein